MLFKLTAAVLDVCSLFLVKMTGKYFTMNATMIFFYCVMNVAVVNISLINSNPIIFPGHEQIFLIHS
jgi:hypothetical protein